MMATADFKNNVTRLLDAQKVKHQVFTYDYDAGGSSNTFHGSLTSANSSDYTPGALAPTVTVRQGDQSFDVPVNADGTFAVDGMSGPFLVTIKRPGQETRTHPVDWPNQTQCQGILYHNDNCRR